MESSIQLVLPSTAIGFIIGRAGHSLEELRHACGVQVRISGKGNIVVGERLVWVEGPQEGLFTACKVS